MGRIAITKGAEMAIAVCNTLAKESDLTFSTEWLADDLDYSKAHLSKILQQLNRRHIVKSIRGAFGGFQMAADPENLTVAQVIEAIDGPLEVSPSVHERVRGVEERIVRAVLESLSDMKVEEL